MTLHEAIEKLLQQTKRPMTANEIVDELNKSKWYAKKDKSLIKSGQIIARVNKYQKIFDVDRTATPLQIKLLGKKSSPATVRPVLKIEKIKKAKITQKQNTANLKKSFEAISDSETSILILGTIPGDKSLELKEYYGHPRNRFWKIISTIANKPLPLTYLDKKSLLHKTKIGVWDVAHQAIRKGSLDKAIEYEEPNDLNSFITKHKHLKTIAFNGKKSEALFDKYFARKKEINYITLPSSSPANASIDFNSICNSWRLILKSN